MLAAKRARRRRREARAGQGGPQWTVPHAKACKERQAFKRSQTPKKKAQKIARMVPQCTFASSNVCSWPVFVFFVQSKTWGEVGAATLVEAETKAMELQLSTPRIQGDTTRKTRSTHAKVLNLARTALREATASKQQKAAQTALKMEKGKRAKSELALLEAQKEIAALKGQLAVKDEERDKKVCVCLLCVCMCLCFCCCAHCVHCFFFARCLRCSQESEL